MFSSVSQIGKTKCGELKELLIFLPYSFIIQTKNKAVKIFSLKTIDLSES